MLMRDDEDTLDVSRDLTTILNCRDWAELVEAPSLTSFRTGAEESADDVHPMIRDADSSLRSQLDPNEQGKYQMQLH